MGARYVEPKKQRFLVERVDGTEQVRVPIRRNWFILLFLPFWLCGWTAGGIAAMWSFAQTHEPFLFFWLCMWAIGWVFAAGTLAMQLGGGQVLRVIGGDLEVSDGIGPFRRSRRYRGNDIANLTSSDPSGDWPSFMMRYPEFPFSKSRRGAAKFDYGAETIYLASGAEEAEGRMIVEWLRPKLPRTAAA